MWLHECNAFSINKTCWLLGVNVEGIFAGGKTPILDKFVSNDYVLYSENSLSLGELNAAWYFD